MFGVGYILQTIALIIVMRSIRMAFQKRFGALAVYAAGAVLWGAASLLHYFSAIELALVIIGSSVLVVQFPRLMQKRKEGGALLC